MSYRLLDAFRGLFEGEQYKHRDSSLGDYVASFLYEDLVALGRSPKLVSKVKGGTAALNSANKTVGVVARRGDGTFGEVVPGARLIVVEGFLVPRGPIASIEIGAETKILAKAMIKQIDRVMSDLRGQVDHFKRSNPNAICVAVVGVNHAEECSSYEGTRETPTDGKKNKHPFQEAAEAEARLAAHVRSSFSEFILLRYKATNRPPYPFSWVDQAQTELEYAAALLRICLQYESRF